MKWVDELKKVLETSAREDDFPDYLAADVNKIIESAEKYDGKTDLIEDLIHHVRMYDTYADSGCFNNSSSPEDVQQALRDLFAAE